MSDSKAMKLPDDTNLPFFAYGVFKRNQLCYSRIEDLVVSVQEGFTQGCLYERDGIPLFAQEGNSHVKGSLISFVDATDGYRRIMEIEPEKQYKWAEVKVRDLGEANILIGRKPRRGGQLIEHCDDWDGRNDPYFKEALEVVENTLSEAALFEHDYKNLFRVQMAYMLIWSSIERYICLKYIIGDNTSINEKIKKLASEESFRTGLIKYVNNERHVFRADNPEKKAVLKKDNPKKSIEYYYQVRSNVVHRGKVACRDFDTVKESSIELLRIFRDVLKETFSDA